MILTNISRIYVYTYTCLSNYAFTYIISFHMQQHHNTIHINNSCRMNITYSRSSHTFSYFSFESHIYVYILFMHIHYPYTHTQPYCTYNPNINHITLTYQTWIPYTCIHTCENALSCIPIHIYVTILYHVSCNWDKPVFVHTISFQPFI